MAKRGIWVSWMVYAVVAVLIAMACRAWPNRPEDRWRQRMEAAQWQQKQINAGKAGPPLTVRPAWRQASWMDALREWDHSVFFRINKGWSNRVTSTTMPVITYLGDGVTQAFLLLALLGWASVRGRQRWRTTARLALIMLAVGIAASLLKLAFPRYRPPTLFPYDIVLLVKPLYAGSFPSGHTFIAFGVAGVFAFRHAWLFPWAISLAALVGLSRIFVGVHFPLDVLASSIVSTILAGCLVSWHRRMSSRLASDDRSDANPSHEPSIKDYTMKSGAKKI